MHKYILFILLIFYSIGCQSTRNYGPSYTINDVQSAWNAGNYELAASYINNISLYANGTNDELVRKLDQALILFEANDLAGCDKAFTEADKLIEEYDAQAKIKLSNEAGALLTNQSRLPYRGRSYDKIMLSTYKALYFMNLLNNNEMDSQALKDKIIVELNRSYQRQKDAVADNQKRIQKASEDRYNRKYDSIFYNGQKVDPYDTDKAIKDYSFTNATQGFLDTIDNNIVYKDYVNPFSVFLEGLYFIHNPESASDKERGLKAFERLSGMVNNEYIIQDLEMAKEIASYKNQSNLTYVIFASGSAPHREEIKIDIPLYIKELPYTGAAFPKLRYNENYHKTLSVFESDRSNSLKSKLICDFDAIVSLDFKNEWPVVVTKTILSSTTKAIAAKKIHDYAEEKGGTWGLIGAQILTSSYQASMNKADTRFWTTCQKNFLMLE